MAKGKRICGKGIAKSNSKSCAKRLKFSKKKSAYLKNPKNARLNRMPRIR